MNRRVANFGPQDMAQAKTLGEELNGCVDGDARRVWTPRGADGKSIYKFSGWRGFWASLGGYPPERLSDCQCWQVAVLLGCDDD